MDRKVLAVVRTVLVLFLHTFVSAVLPAESRGADIFVGTKVPVDQQVPLSEIRHAAWTQLLEKYVDARGMVHYRNWKANAADTRSLETYLRQLSTSNGVGSNAEKLAFWINAYNALTIHGILKEYPTSSIRNHTAILFGYNIWKNLKLYVAGQPFSLEQIEHDILRKSADARIHFPIVCASKGCPRLRTTAYTPDQVNQQLHDNTQRFFGDRSKFHFDANQNVFYISPILKWFAEDFGETTASRLATIAPWLTDPRAAKAARLGQASITYLNYDWDLNDQS